MGSFLLKLVLSAATIAASFLLIADIAAQIAVVKTLTCESIPSPVAAAAANTSDLDAAIRDLISISYLAAGDLALCVGPGSSATAAAMRRVGISDAVRSSATACCGLPFDADSFDFALAASLDRVRVPARVVLEMERVIRPGRIGVVLRIRPGVIRPDDLMKAAAPVASLLRFSDVIGARALNGSAMVVFRKQGPPLNRKSQTGCYDDEMSTMPLVVKRVNGYLQAAVLVAGSHSGHFGQY